MVLLENYDKYKDLLEVSKNSSGSAEEKYLSYQEQLEAQTKKLQAAWESLAQDASVNEFLTMTTKVTTFLVENLPIIIKYASRLAVTMNAYKMPTMLKSVGSFFSIKDKTAGIKNVFSKGMKQASLERTSEYGDRFAESNNRNLTSIQNLVQHIYDKMAGKTTEGTSGSTLPTSNATSSNDKKGKGRGSRSKQRGKGTQEPPITNNNPQEPAENEEALKVQKEQTKQAEKLASAMTVATGTLTNVITSGTTHRNSEGETVDSSEEAEAAIKANTGVLSAVGGLIGAWFGGAQGASLGVSVGGIFGDIGGTYIGEAIDKDRDEMNIRIEEANENLSALSKIQESVSNIEKYSKSNVQSYEEYSQMVEAIQELKSSLVENSDAAYNVFTALEGQEIAGQAINSVEDVYNLIDNYETFDSDTKSLIESMLNLGITKAQSDQTLQSKEGELKTAEENIEKYQNAGVAFKKITRKTTGKGSNIVTHYSEGEDFASWAKEENIPLTVAKDSGVKSDTYRYIIDAEGEDIIEYYEKYLDFLTLQKAKAKDAGETEEELTARQDTIDDIESNIKSYRNNLAQIKSIYEDVNTLRGQAAILEAQIETSSGKTLSLVKANISQLKQLPREEIFKSVAEQLQKNGGLMGYSVYSSEGRSIIEKAIKSNETLYSIFTGQAYTLSEAIEASDLSVLQNFATALGVSIEELSSMQKQFGSFKLAEITMSTSEIRTESEELTELFSNLASSSGLTAENLEKIINSYPELIPYLSSSVSLGEQLLAKVEAYNTLYANSVLSDILGNSTYFSMFKDALKEEDLDAYNALIDSGVGTATTAEQIQAMIGSDYATAQSAYGFGGTEEQFKKIQSLYGEKYTFSIEDVYSKELYQTYLSYITKITDIEIENLNDQKEALEKVNEQRQYELDLMEAKLKLEDAQKEKKRVWREGVGWTYEADQSAIAEAQEALEEVTNQKTISELEAQIAELEAYKERAEQITEDEEIENLRSAYESFLKSNEDSLTSTSAVLDRITGLYQEADLILQGLEAAQNTEKAKQSTFNAIFGSDKNSYWSKVQSAKNAVVEAMKEGESEDEIAALQAIYANAITTYQEKISEYKNLYDLEGAVLDDTSKVSSLQKTFYTGDVDSLSEIRLAGFHASGTTNFSGGTALINELGTEAIVTPEGTITALPSNSGIIPADITENLWKLGELSPLIANSLIGSPSSSSGVETKSYTNSTDESLNINSLIMQVSADQSFDVDAFADALRTRIALTKNNR